MYLNYYQGHQRLFKDKRNTDFSIITIEHEDVQTQIPSQSIVKVPATNQNTHHHLSQSHRTTPSFHH